MYPFAYGVAMWKVAIELARPKNVVIAAFTVPVGAHLAISGDWNYDVVGVVAIQTLSVVMFMAAGNTLNDVADKSIDKIAKPHKPLPSGRISPEQATRLAYMFIVASAILMGIAAYLISYPLVSIMIWFIAAVLMYTYDMGPKTKNYGLIGNIAISLMVGAVIIYGAAAVSLANNHIVLYVAGVAFFANLAREIVKDCEDMETDEGRNTLPMRVGLEWSRAIAYLCVWCALILLYIPHWKGPYSLNELLYHTPAIVALASLNGPLFRGEDHRSQTQIRMGMILGLISFAILVVLEGQ